MMMSNSDGKRDELNERLPQDVLIFHLLPFLCDWRLNDFIALSQVSKSFRALMLSKPTSSMWDIRPFNFCIDGHCCHNCKFIKGTRDSALKVLSTYPMRRIVIHCFTDDVPIILSILSTTGNVTMLSMSLTSKRSSPSLVDLLTSTRYTEGGFSHLTELIVDSSHLMTAAKEGRSKLLSIVGSRLTKLSFCSLASPQIFPVIQTNCPNIVSLRVDRIQDNSELLQYNNPQLTELELRRCHYTFSAQLPFPLLSRLRLSYQFILEEKRLWNVIRYTPCNLVDLTIEIPSSLFDGLIAAITRRLTSLQRLTIEGAHDTGIMSTAAIEALGSKCRQLQYLNLDSPRSIGRLDFEDYIQSFALFSSHFPTLCELRLCYSESHAEGINAMLLSSPSLRRLVLWERFRWLDEQKQSTMQSLASNWRHLSRVEIVLEDVSNACSR